MEENTQNQTEVKPQPKNSVAVPKWMIRTLALLVIVFLVGAGAYFLGSKNSLNKAPQAPAPTVSQMQEIPTSTPVPTKTAVEMKTFSTPKMPNLSFSGYSLKHPANWIESVEKTDVSSQLTLTKGDYQIVINQTPTEGSVCAYQDSDMNQNNPFVVDKRGKPYTDLVAPIGTLRRDMETAPSGVIIYPFCQQASDGTFGVFTKVGILEYNGPKSAYDPATLSEMDDIVKTITAQ